MRIYKKKKKRIILWFWSPFTKNAVKSATFHCRKFTKNKVKSSSKWKNKTKKVEVEETYLYFWVSISLRSSAMASFRSLFGSIPLGASLFACRLSLLTNSTSTSSSWYDSVRVYSRSWNSNTARTLSIRSSIPNKKRTYICHQFFCTAKYWETCIFMKGNKRALREFINVSFRFTWPACARYVDYVRGMIIHFALLNTGKRI